MKKGNGMNVKIFSVLLLTVVVLLALFYFFMGSTGNVVKTLLTQAAGPAYTKINVRPVLCDSFSLSVISSKLWIGDPINKIKSIVTDSELPGLLEDRLDYTNVSIQSTQTLVIGSSIIENDTGNVHIQIGATSSNIFYNYTLTFNRAVNFVTRDSIGELIKMMGQDFIIGTDTSANDLVLYRSGQKVDLSVGGFYPTWKMVNLERKIYTIELLGTTTASAIIKVSEGNISDTKEIVEGTSKRIQGIEVGVISADVSQINSSETAKLLVGAQRYELTNGAEVKEGSDENSIDGTLVSIAHGSTWQSLTGFSISFFAPDSVNNKISIGQTHTNPIFSNLKLVFESYDNTNGAIIKIGGCAWGESCVDTDGGDVPLTKGTFTYWTKSATDYCFTENVLWEYYCGVDSLPVVADYSCTYSCINGACKPAPVTSSCTYNKKLGGYVCT